VVIGPDGIAQFDELRRRSGAEHAMLYGFDLIELNGVDLRRHPLLERKRERRSSPLRSSFARGGVTMDDPGCWQGVTL
jgi:hypothetical protein